MSRVLHLLPHPGGGGERQHRLLEAGLSRYTHEFAALAGRQGLPWAVPGLLFRRPFVAARTRRADLVHVDGDTTAILSVNLVGAAPYVITTAGLHLLRRSTGRQRSVVRRRLRDRVQRSRATMCTSRAELEELSELCGAEAPLMLVRNGVPAPSLPSPDERAHARETLSLSDDTVAIAMLSRLEPRKQPLVAARAARKARDAGAPVTLLAAGDGPLRRELSRLAGPSVRPLGFRDDPQLLLAAADLFVLMSEWEGLSLGLLEAMGVGLPAIVSDAPGNAEVVNERCGAVVAIGDEDALAEAFVRFSELRELRLQAGAAARQRVEQEFSLEQMVRGVEMAYERVLG